jgi:IS30 family transposase
MSAGRHVTADIAAQCRSLARRRIARQQIAYQLGIHKSTVSRILDGSTPAYRHAARRAAAVSISRAGPREVDAVEYAQAWARERLARLMGRGT